MIGPVRPAEIAVPSGPQSTVAAALSQAISPVTKARKPSVQRFSDVLICARSKRRGRADTGILPSRVSSTSQTTSITSPIDSATHGYAVLSIGDRSDEPAHAAMGSAQMMLLKAANPV